MNKKKIKIVTHAGGFHSDELFAIALIKKFFCSNIDIQRTRDSSILAEYLSDSSVWVIDVGGVYEKKFKNFDHHQVSFNDTWNGTNILFSSCGLVWQYLKEEGFLSKLLSNFQINEFENKLIKRIDAHDNGSGRWSHAVMFKLFNRDECDSNNGFFDALQLACNYIDNSIYYFANEELNISKLYKHKYIFDGKVVLIDDDLFHVIPSISANTDAKVIIEYKKSDNAWSVQSLSPSILSPISWRGVSEVELHKKSGDDKLIFAHRSGHLVKTKTRDSAIAVAKQMVDELGS
ncbi:MYG1 family protein [Photobacterium kishitanii]|uniref:Metal-dependent hydrolase n=1 Tax=Photobacterium kishitanii TaxID=318456 RepID=A0A2T3KN13_9GAMM|nr:MYG1 family protein [Photobacterium kishitanii]PSV01135.1 hypothetical protein C9J27_03690 [Photobacterium kishitanii]